MSDPLSETLKEMKIAAVVLLLLGVACAGIYTYKNLPLSPSELKQIQLESDTKFMLRDALVRERARERAHELLATINDLETKKEYSRIARQGTAGTREALREAKAMIANPAGDAMLDEQLRRYREEYRRAIAESQVPPR
jgi:hypothetical protein